MELEQTATLNDFTITLSDLKDFLYNKHQYKKSQKQCEVDEEKIFIYYQHPSFPKNIFMRETWLKDSYDMNTPTIYDGVDLVKIIEKQVTTYEEITTWKD